MTMFIWWKKCAIVWLDAENANQIAVSHPLNACDDSYFSKRNSASMHANLLVATITERGVEIIKKKQQKNTRTLSVLSFQRQTLLTYFESVQF